MMSRQSYQIEIHNEQSAATVDLELLRGVAVNTLQLQGVLEATLSLILLDNASIHQWNRKTLNHDFPTDVITFDLGDGQAPDDDRCSIEGELLISVEMAVELSQQVGWSTDQEVALYMIHGILHLVGYDDLSDQAQRLMRQREREIIVALGWHTGPSEDRWSEI